MINILVIFNLLILIVLLYWMVIDISKYIGIIVIILGVILSFYFFIFRQYKMMFMKLIKFINDFIIKNNEKFIDLMLYDLDEFKGKVEFEKDWKKVFLYLIFIKVEIDNFLCGGLIILVFKIFSFVKNIKKNLNKYYFEYYELIIFDIVIENLSMIIDLKRKDLLIDDVIYLSK